MKKHKKNISKKKLGFEGRRVRNGHKFKVLSAKS